MMLLFTREDDQTRHKIIDFGQQLVLGTSREHFCPRASVLALHF